MKIPEFDFHHCCVSVPNLDEAVEWYSRVFDASLEWRMYNEVAQVHGAMLQRGALRFEIFQPDVANPLPEDRRDPHTDFQTHGNKHAAFRVDDLDALLPALEAKGVDIAFVIREEAFKGCFIRDCAGNLIEFVQQPRA